jgi:hypothetical protein
MLCELRFNNLDQLAKIFPLHLFAFSVEVKPSIVYIIFFKLAEHLSKLISYLLLTPFFIN